MSNGRVWQPEVLEKLRDQLGDDDGVMALEVIKVYLVQARELLAQIEVAARESDEYQLRGLAHSLKGSSATVGASRLAAVCERIEHASSAELASPEISVRVAQEFQLLSAELERYRPLRGVGAPGWRVDLTRGGRTAGRFPA
jgi:HPt (histidine-containing phosphotransfer) domain-containing protein